MPEKKKKKEGEGGRGGGGEEEKTRTRRAKRRYRTVACGTRSEQWSIGSRLLSTSTSSSSCTMDTSANTEDPPDRLASGRAAARLDTGRWPRGTAVTSSSSRTTQRPTSWPHSDQHSSPSCGVEHSNSGEKSFDSIRQSDKFAACTLIFK